MSPAEHIIITFIGIIRRTFQDAYNLRSPSLPLTFHTDRGSNFRSETFCNLLQQLGVTQSFSKASTPYDNSVIESFFSSLKREELYRKKYRSEKEFRTALDDYMDFYNADRPHAHNKYRHHSRLNAIFTVIMRISAPKESDKWVHVVKLFRFFFPILSFFHFCVRLPFSQSKPENPHK